jgi:hypothetical protein
MASNGHTGQTENEAISRFEVAGTTQPYPLAIDVDGTLLTHATTACCERCVLHHYAPSPPRIPALSVEHRTQVMGEQLHAS